MTSLDNQESALEKLCSAAIERRLGDISEHPAELVTYVRKVYREFIAGYLNMLRQKKNKPIDWTPETLSFDTELTDGMRHFFSDYQHITREFSGMNQKMERLLEIEKEHQPKLYQHAIDDILKGANRSVTPGDEYETTG